MFLGSLFDVLRQPTQVVTGLGRTGLKQGALLRERYRVVQILSQAGGWGETYVARDLDIPGVPRCVIKLLKPATKEPASLEIAEELFQREAETLKELGKHPQIPGLLAYFQLNGNFYLVQEFVDGFPIGSELIPSLQWSDSKVVTLLLEVLSILTFVHSRDVIHRDIKPNNLMRRRHDGRIVLIDFGAVKKVSDLSSIAPSQVDPLTVSIGTSGYMPTEQYAGRPRVNSDIYALGIVCIQALTGIEPRELQTDRDDEIIWQEHTQASQPLINIISKMICSQARNRYQTAEEVLQDIEEHFPEKVAHHSSINQEKISESVDDIFREEDNRIIRKYSRKTSLNRLTLGMGLLVLFASLSVIGTTRLRILGQGLISGYFYEYTELYAHLEFKRWEIADQKTFDLILKLTGEKSKGQGRLALQEWQQVLQDPGYCKHMQAIDRLWALASREQLGFKAQNQVFLISEHNLLIFYKRVLWLDKDLTEWLVHWKYDKGLTSYVEKPNFRSPTSIKGHLPALMEWEIDVKNGQTEPEERRFQMFDSCEII
ncbi:MAG: GUN4 domain-containing protein [Cyanobacteria bacterium P01_B01_bin.77]